MAKHLHTSRLFIDMQNDLEALVRVLPSFVMVLSPEGSILTCNDAAAHFLRLRYRDLAGQSILDVWPSNTSILQDRLWQVVNLHIPDSFEVTLGEQAAVIYLYPIMDKDVVANIVIFGQDVTDRKKSEEQVRELTTMLEKKVAERTQELETANQQLIREKQRAELLAHFSQMLMENPQNYHNLLQEIAKAVSYLIGEVCAISEFLPDQKSFRIEAISDVDPIMSYKLTQAFLGLVVPNETSPVTMQALKGESFTTKDINPGNLRDVLKPEFAPILEKLTFKNLRANPLVSGEGTLGVIIVGRSINTNDFDNDETAFLNSLASLLGLAIHNARLVSQLTRSREQLRGLSQQLVQTQESQFRHLAKELHDQVGQDMTAITINLSLMRSMILEDSMKLIGKRLDDTIKLAESTVEHMRNIMAEFRPPVLDAYGLTAALYWYAEQFSGRTGINVIVHDMGLKEIRMPADIEIGLFRIAQEALNNVAKHAKASQVDIQFKEEDEKLLMSIEDDGVGFDPINKKSGKLGHWGLTIMRERAEAINGVFEFNSMPNKGTSILVTLPYLRKS